MNLFSRYGTVTHCVILATVDNSSRRRGFVVMSTHEEAKLAMDSLTRTQLKCVNIIGVHIYTNLVSEVTALTYLGLLFNDPEVNLNHVLHISAF